MSGSMNARILSGGTKSSELSESLLHAVIELGAS